MDLENCDSDGIGKLPVKLVWESVTRHNLVSQHVGRMLKDMKDPDGTTDYRAFVERLRCGNNSALFVVLILMQK